MLGVGLAFAFGQAANLPATAALPITVPITLPKPGQTWDYPAWGKNTFQPLPGHPLTFPRWSFEALVAISRQPGLASLHRDVALICQSGSEPTDAASAFPDCDAGLIDAHGAWVPLGRHRLLAALRLPSDRLLLLTRDLSLVLRDALGGEKLLASAVADPRVSDDGARVVFTQFPSGTRSLAPGNRGIIAGLKVADGLRWTVTEDAMASSPFPVPGSDDVLFLSARTGLASIWLASPGKPDRQITNRGKTRVDAGFIPVFGRELVWIPGTRTAVYTASYGTHSLWKLDLETAKAVRLGPGRLPQLAEGAAILAVDDDSRAASSVVRYPLRYQP